MKVKIKNQAIEDDVSIAGLLECKLKYEIKDTKGEFAWTGPKIPPEVWHQILAFFKWTYDTTHSESQVRLYVSPVHQTWRAWAFPQEAKTGMTARELDNDDSKSQRAELNMNPPEWFYFGTVHHHCSASAFQSGTDKENEESQDGLHITVGKLDEKEYDIHARFYRKGLKFEPNMAWFYDVEPILSQCPEVFRPFLPKDLDNQTARKMMCQPAPDTTEIPQPWKNNLVEIKPSAPVNHPCVYTGPGSWNQSNLSNIPSSYSSENDPLWKRSKKAWDEIIYLAAEAECPAADIEAALSDMSLDGWPYSIVLKACLHHKVDADDLNRELPATLDQDITNTLFELQKEAETKKGDQEKSEAKGGETPNPNDDGEWPQSYCIS